MEEIVKGIERYWLADGAVAAYLLHDIHDGNAPVLSESIRSTLMDWPHDQPFRTIFNVSIAGSSMNYMMATSKQVYNVGVTEEGRQWVEEFLANNPDIRIFVALVISKQISGNRMRRELLTGMVDENVQLVGQTFFEMEHALEWLMELG